MQTRKKMPAGSRRVHTKSRNGCGQCKRRKVKCNEQAPRCANCCKWQQLCDFEVDGGVKGRNVKVRTLIAGASTGRESPVPAVLPSVNLMHLELMHHYLTFTSFTLQRPRDPGQMWSIIVPSQAFHHEFLMHAVLGVSALHIAHLSNASDSKNQYLARARIHQHEALTLFRSTVKEITPENCTAAVMFSCLLLISSCAITSTTDATPSHEHIDALVTILMSFRSHWKLFASAQQWEEAKPLAEFLPVYENAGSNVEALKDTRTIEALQELYDFNANSQGNEEEREICEDAILGIQQSLYCGATLPRVIWPIILSSRFLHLLQLKRPMALVILAHGCALSKFGPYRWFFHEWTMRVGHAIADMLDPVWLVGMKWPLMELGFIEELSRI